MFESLNNLINNYTYENMDVLKMQTFNEEFRYLFNNKKIVIFGAGVSGKFYYDFFKYQNIKISYYVDNNADTIKNIFELNVYSLKHLKDEKVDTIVIVAANPTMVNSMFLDLENLKLSSNILVLKGDKLISIAKCSQCLNNIEEDKNILFSECSICYNEESECSAFKKYLKKSQNINIKNNNLPRFGLIGYILGQKCTLNCLHCCEGIPFIQDKKMSEKDQTVYDIKKLAASSEYIGRIEFIGGEPFLNKDLPNILEEVLKIKKIGYVVVFTNGTIIPNDKLLQVLKNERIVVNFSSYDEKVANVKEGTSKKIISILRDNRINLAVYNPHSRSWLDFNTFEKRTATTTQLKDYLDKCFISYCHRVFDGAFYSCPHYYTGVELGKVKKFENEFIDIHNLTEVELSKSLFDMQKLKIRKSCSFCNLPYDAPEVKPAIQYNERRLHQNA